METVKKLLAIKEIPKSLALEASVYLEATFAVVVISIPSSITKEDLDILCNNIFEGLIKERLTIAGKIWLEDIDSLIFKINYPL